MNNQKSVEDILSSVADVTVHSNAVQHLVRDSSDQPHERTIADAIELLFHASQIDGAHHKAWVIDQALRILTGANYPQAVAEYSFDGLDLTEGKAEYYQQVIDGFAGDDGELERIEENYQVSSEKAAGSSAQPMNQTTFCLLTYSKTVPVLTFPTVPQ